MFDNVIVLRASFRDSILHSRNNNQQRPQNLLLTFSLDFFLFFLFFCFIIFIFGVSFAFRLSTLIFSKGTVSQLFLYK